jgi:hypothetical protein
MGESTLSPSLSLSLSRAHTHTLLSQAGGGKWGLKVRAM